MVPLFVKNRISCKQIFNGEKILIEIQMSSSDLIAVRLLNIYPPLAWYHVTPGHPSHKLPTYFLYIFNFYFNLNRKSEVGC